MNMLEGRLKAWDKIDKFNLEQQSYGNHDLAHEHHSQRTPEGTSELHAVWID